MPDFLKIYGDTEGPLGFPMKDEQAQAVEAILKTLPEEDYQRRVIAKGVSEVSTGERSDVSWITTETLDRDKEIVLVSGFNDSQFKANPIVTLNHDYSRSPVGRSLWRRRLKDGSTKGIKAKTIYPPKPLDWREEQEWHPDTAFELIQAGLMNGKSIGFLTLKAHSPTDEEVKSNPEWKGARRIIDEWMLLEYCATWLPINPEAVVEAINKSLIKPDILKAIGYELPKPAPDPTIPHRPIDDIERLLTTQLNALDIKSMVEKLCQDAFAKVTGKV